jgi:TPR repeat protein
LPDTEWIAGILHEEGNIVDKDLDKAIIYYEQARKKKNNEALYRLGSLNERGLYGKPYDYLKMWE